MNKYIIGIDEAGRGPLAGPLAVGACMIRADSAHKILEFFPKGEVRDSKKLTPKKREEIFEELHKAKERGEIFYSVSFAGANIIDEKGLSFAIKFALEESLNDLKISGEECLVLLDGGLKAPARFREQRTIIKGDEKEAIIALASVVAKVSRDREMVLLHEKYPQYDFATHKGYGTKLHYAKLKEHGLSPIHRISFLKNL